MKFVGLLLKESLQDESILDLIRVTKTETWHVEGDVDSRFGRRYHLKATPVKLMP